MIICFTQPICRGLYRLHSALPPPHHRLPRPQVLYTRTFNICDGRGFGLSQYIWEAHIGGFNLMILMYIKTTNQAYYHNMMGYDVMYLLEIMADDGGS